MKSTLNIHWKDWCWSWGSNTLATWCKKLTYWKRPWCWERWKAEGEEGDRWWDGWMRSPVQWEKVRNREVWCAAVHGIAESDMISHWTTTTIVQNLPASVGDTEDIGSIPGLGRSPDEGNGNLLPVFLPRKFHGQKRLVDYCPWGPKESGMIEWLTQHKMWTE